MRVAIYRRISTDEAHQPFSLDAQETKLRAYVASQDDWHLVGEPYTDQASGATLDRPALKKALGHAKAGRFDILLVYRVDRLARSIRGLAHILDELDQAKVAFRSATEPFDTSTPAGRMLVQMLGVFAEFERATIIDRVINGMERKAARGGWPIPQRPYGYLINAEDNHSLYPHPDEAAVVGQVFDLYVNKHMGTKAIARTLTERGLRTKNGKPWSGESLILLIRNRVYLGEIFFRETWYASSTATPFHQPLIDQKTFDRAQAILDARGEAWRKNQVMTSSDYWLTGLMNCNACGKSYVGSNARGRSRTYRYYVCFSRSRYGVATCRSDRIPADQLETGVLQSMLDTYEDCELIDTAITEIVERNGSLRGQHEMELKTVEGSIKTAEASIDRYLIAFEKGSIPEDVCGNRIRELTATIVQLRARRHDLQELLSLAPEGPRPAMLDQLRTRVRQAVEGGDERTKKALIQSLTHKIQITGRFQVQPYFLVPLMGDEEAVRALATTVDGTGIEPVTLRL